MLNLLRKLYKAYVISFLLGENPVLDYVYINKGHAT